ncbi:MAG: polymerase subunit sigma [Fibrobacteres bacterium]|nr:polymerase subunit sigma [Fibrobacterota bacterium]
MVAPYEKAPAIPDNKSKSRGKILKFIGDEDRESLYLNSIRNSKRLSREEECEAAGRIQQGDMRAVNILVNANLKFVVSVCRNYRNQGLPFGDLINEGNLGLIRAAQRFDAKQNCRFISYAVWWIRQGILVALSEQTRFLKVAPGRIHVMRKVAKAGQKLEQKLGRTPVAEELAAVLDLSVEKLTEYTQLSLKSVSMSAPASDGGAGLEETLEDSNSPQADEEAKGFLMRKKMAGLLDSLDERRAMVLKLYYGIGSECAMPLSDIANKLNLTRERVRQIKAGALSMLRHPAKIKLAATFQS